LTTKTQNDMTLWDKNSASFKITWQMYININNSFTVEFKYGLQRKQELDLTLLKSVSTLCCKNGMFDSTIQPSVHIS